MTNGDENEIIIKGTHPNAPLIALLYALSETDDLIDALHYCDDETFSLHPFAREIARLIWAICDSQQRNRSDSTIDDLLDLLRSALTGN